MSKFAKISFKLLDLLIIFVLTFGSPMSALAYVWTDPTDYPPGSTVTIRGDNSDEDNERNFAGSETVQVDVVGPNGYTATCSGNADEFGAWQCDVVLWDTLDAEGAYTYTATGLTSGNVEVGTFTDASLAASVSLTNWQTSGPGGARWVTATLGSNNSNYKEGETVPFRIEMTNSNTPVSGNPWYAPICRDYSIDTNDGTVYGYTQLQPFDTSRGATPGGAIISTMGAFSGVGLEILQVVDTGTTSGSLDNILFDCGSTQQLVIVKFNAVGNTTRFLLWGGRLSMPGDTDPTNIAFGHSSSFYPGGSLQMRLASPDKTGGINPGAIIQLARITVTKVVDSGSATPDQWCFTVVGPNGYNVTQCIPTGQSSVDFLGLDTGTYTPITESTVAGYAFVSGSGTNCTFNGSTATATVTAAAGGATSASCTFHNSIQQGSLTVIKHVVNDNGGTATADQWSIHVKSGGTDVPGSPQAGSETGTIYNLTAGTYNVSESGGSSGYTFTGFSGDCDSSGNVAVVPGQNKTCTLTNDDNAPALYLVKHVVNDSGGTATADQWTLFAGSNGVTGSETGELATNLAGTYALSETSVDGYTNTSITCSDNPGVEVTSVTLDLGESITCTFVNDDAAASLTLIKHVINDNGGTADADDWTLYAGANSVTGSETGAVVTNQAGTYALSETSVTGYSNTSVTCDNGDGPDSVTVGLGESVTCTFVNDDDAASLTLIKHVINDNGGTAEADDWTLYAGTNSVTGSETGALATNQAGTYALSESSVSGYSNTSISCDNGDGPGSVTVELGESVTCTFVNDDLAPALYLVKHVVNNNGGTAVASDWTLNAGSNSVTGSETGTLATDQAGTYNLSESSVDGYTNTSITCDNSNGEVTSVTLGLGEIVTCTFVNDDNAASLTLIKHVVNNNGGTAVASDWTLSAGSNSVTGSEAGALATDQAGTYALSETSVPGYANTSVICDNGDGPGSVTVGLGESVTCTFVNDDMAPSLYLVKHVVNNNGGTAVASDWTLNAGANSVTGSETGALATNQAGTYSLSESSVPGYSNTSISCDNGDGPGSVTIELGETVTCTFVNDDLAPALYLVKQVINDNGGTAVASDWTLSAGANSVPGSEAGALATNQAGTYALSESSVDGYSNTSVSCDNGDGPDSVTLELGETVICTFINDDDAASLILVKHVVNDNGGTADADDWTLYADALSVPGSESGAEVTDQAGTYNLSESSVAGYSNTSVTCSNGDGPDSVTVGLGETVTCTFVNDDQTAHLTLVKVVINDNGGTATTTDWTLIADDGSALPLPAHYGAGGFDGDVNASTYALSEIGPSGYTASEWVCEGGTQSGSNITLALGESATCTIINNDNPPALTLVKVVINDNGGTAVAANWTLTATGPSGFSGPGPNVSNGPSFDAGTYDLSESGPAGYSASNWECDGGTQDDSDTITLGLGESATCTITNNDIPPQLHLRKVIVNNNGGTATLADFVLTADGTGSNDLSGNSPVDSGAGLQADTWTLSETGPAGYAASAWNCVGGTQVGDQITVGIGGEATCTITNNDIPPQLHLRKVVLNNNGGTASATAWTLTADGSGGNDLSGSTPVDSGAGLQADTFALSESGPAGYSASAWSCVGGTQDGSNITVGIGQSATCTITNDDIAPSLTLDKIVVNDNGGTAAESAWTLTANGGLAGILSGAGAAGNADVVSGAGFKAGTYTLSESAGPYGYTAGSWSCVKNGGSAVTGNSITLGLGDTATCTIINNDKPGTIIVEKLIKPVGALTSFNFQTTGDGGANALPDYQNFSLSGGNLNSQTLDAGSYTVKELVPLGWALTGIGGGLPVSADSSNTKYYCTVTGSGGSTGVGDLLTQTATIDLKNGDTVKCVFENTGQGATRTQGFWATHLALAKIAWEGGSGFGHTFPGVAAVAGIGDTLICGRDVDAWGITAGSNQLMGGFWSDISKKSNNTRRTALDQARMQLLQQLLAAELNASAFGSVPSGGSGMFAQWEAALCGTSQSAITTAKQQAASFNTNGDSATFTPGTSADSRTGRFVADIVFWNIIRP